MSSHQHIDRMDCYSIAFESAAAARRFLHEPGNVGFHSGEGHVYYVRTQVPIAALMAREPCIIGVVRLDDSLWDALSVQFPLVSEHHGF